jgi:hypothetical protein
MRRFAILGVALGLLSAANPTAGQEGDPPQEAVASLEDVEELTRLGRSEEARVALVAWWEEARADASRRDRQRALWLRGSLTVDPGQAELDFRRLVIEFPGGPFSDRALLRLAQGAHASGDGDGANAYMATLARDYPRSTVRRDAEAWFARAGPVPERTLLLVEGEGPATEDRESGGAEPGVVEPEVVEAEVVDAQAAESEAPAVEAPARVAEDAPRYSVQLGAFANEDRARSLFRRAADLGLEARLVHVPETQLLHVRVGLFDDASAAGELLRRVGEMGFVAAMVRDAHREETIRR